MVVAGQMEGGARRVGWERGCPRMWGRGFICGVGMALRQAWWLSLMALVLGISSTCLSTPQHVLGVRGSFPILT